MFARIATSKSKTFLAFCFCFLAGIAAGSILNRRVDFIYFYTILVILLPSIIIVRKNKTQLFIVSCSLLIVIGFARYTFALPKQFDLPTAEQTFTAAVTAEPDVRQDGVRYIVEVKSHKSKVISQVDRIYFKSDPYPRYEYGAVLQITCKLQKPEPFDGFRYDM